MPDITRRTAVLAATTLPTGAERSKTPSGISCDKRWVAAWVASMQGPYPVGNTVAQPNLRWAFPDPARGARNQTFRLIVRPDVWGPEARLRFSNAFGTQSVILDDVHIALQESGSAILRGTEGKVSFAGSRSAIVGPGKSIVADPTALPFWKDNDYLLAGRKLSITFHVVGESGPLTWHATAVSTSYLTPPDSGALGGATGDAEFPFSTTSWFFLEGVDMRVQVPTRVVVSFGDSITDGTGSTLNGDDRWTDVLSRRLRASGVRAAVVNAGIGGNQVLHPTEYSATQPFHGGPSALSRLERDVISVPGVTHVIWLQGINDFSRNGNASAEAVINGIKHGVAIMRSRIEGLKVIGATVVSALGSPGAADGFPEQDLKRRILNDFIRAGGLFDGVIDFDHATLDLSTGEMKALFVPDSSTGGPGDKLHPNRAGYAAMAFEIDLSLID
jgi:lysophospholipase L1-like esterase